MRIYAWSAFFIILYESTIWVNDLSWNVNRKQFSRINYVICEIIVPNYETDTDRHPFRDWTLLRHHWNHNSISLSSRIDKPTVMILSLRHCRKGWWRIWWLARNIKMNSRLPPYGRLNIFWILLTQCILKKVQAVRLQLSQLFLKTYEIP